MSKNVLSEYKRWLEHEDLDLRLKKELIDMEGDENAIYEAFYRNLDFGTSGLRGIMGAGTNRMNVNVVKWVSQGVSNYMKKNGVPKKAVVCYDSRKNSRFFAENTAAVLGANGIKVYIYRDIMPVSACSYAVRHYGAGCGIMITASHNPKEYNGYKVYGSKGYQITGTVPEGILLETKKLDIFNDVNFIDFEKLLGEEIVYISPEVEDRYVVDGFKCAPPLADAGCLKVVYTPLHGSGNVPVQKILKLSGVGEMHVVRSQESPDGDFPTCILPNPEDPRVFERGKRLCEEKDCDIILATDPDCDRIGLLQRTKEGYIRPSGNEIGLLLFDYICKNTVLPKDPVLVTTIVSSDMVDKIAEEYKVQVERTLTGFKYIGERLEELKERYIFGFEEGYGYLAGDFVRDKDGVSSAMLIAQMTAYHKERGKNLAEAMEELYQKYGYHEDKVIGFDFYGSAGAEKMASIMRTLRESDNHWMKPIAQKKDYEDGEGLPAANVLEYKFYDGTRALIRPSGTEPKIKAYLFARGDDREKAMAKLEENEKNVRNILKI